MSVALVTGTAARVADLAPALEKEGFATHAAASGALPHVEEISAALARGHTDVARRRAEIAAIVRRDPAAGRSSGKTPAAWPSSALGANAALSPHLGFAEWRLELMGLLELPDRGLGGGTSAHDGTHGNGETRLRLDLTRGSDP